MGTLVLKKVLRPLRRRWPGWRRFWKRLGKRLGGKAWRRRPSPARLAAGAALLGALGIGCLAYSRIGHGGAGKVQVALRGWMLRLPGARPGSPEAAFEGPFPLGATLFLPPGEAFVLRTEPPGLAGTFDPEDDGEAWRRAGGTLTKRSGAEQGAAADENTWAGQAPYRPGCYVWRWQGAPPGSENERLTLLVMARAKQERRGRRIRVSLGGRLIGNYPDPERTASKTIRAHAQRYRPPLFFVPLNEETVQLFVGEGLRLGQMVAFLEQRDAQGRKIITKRRHTQVLPPSPALYRKLTLLRQRLRAEGVALTRFWITSGFRTPEYNRRIGGAAFSRHGYGGAVDLCVDEDGDLRMDDLNGDGKLDRRDGLLIARACARLEAEGRVVPGGIGVYEWDGKYSVRSHVHVDCRGFPARWGQVSRGGKKRSFEWK